MDDELRISFFLNVDPRPDLSRNVELGAAFLPSIIVGGSHAKRLAASATNPGQALSATRPVWRAGKTAIENVVSELDDMKPLITPGHAAVLQLLDNVAYNAVSEDTVIPCCKGHNGRYHVDGDVMLAPPEMLKSFLRNCLPIFQPLLEQQKLVLVAMPGYMTGGRCEKPDDAPNRKDDDFHRGILSVFTNRVRNFKVVSPLWLMTGAKKNDDDLQLKINTLWEEDPIHPTESGYSSLLMALRVAAREELDKKKPGNSSSTNQCKMARPEWRRGARFTGDGTSSGGVPPWVRGRGVLPHGLPQRGRPYRRRNF